MHLVIRADGGPEIGYGHLLRSNVLVDEILSRDHDITVATATPQSARSVFSNNAEIFELPSRDNSEPFVDLIDANKPAAVFTDSYSVDTEYQREIRDRVPLAVLQDDDRHAVCADLFVNGNMYATNLDYEFVGQKPKTCLGTDYVLLRSEIRNRATDEPPWREQPERALVTMGGSDIADLTPIAIRAFEGFDIHVDTIVGPGFSQAQEQSIRAAADDISSDVSVMRDPNDLVERMFQADFAVSTSSSTTYELLALGTSIISVPVADNQELIAQSLREINAANVLERGPDTEEFRRALEAYVSGSESRRKHRELGRQLVDERGPERINAEILSMAENES